MKAIGPSLCVPLEAKQKLGEASEMAAEVSSLVRVLNGYNKEDQHRTVGNDSSGEKSMAPITRDLLGGSSSSTSSSSKLVESQELDLDLQVPNGWEKRLDLKVRLFSLLGRFSWNSPLFYDKIALLTADFCFCRMACFEASSLILLTGFFWVFLFVLVW